MQQNYINYVKIMKNFMGDSYRKIAYRNIVTINKFYRNNVFVLTLLCSCHSIIICIAFLVSGRYYSPLASCAENI